MIRARLSVLLLTVLFLANSHGQEQISYVKIPDRFDFPADQNILLGYVAQGKTAEMRRHAWMVFAGLTSPTKYTFPNTLPGAPDIHVPVWETWYRREDVFPQLTSPPAAVHPLTHPFVTPRQFESSSGVLAPLSVLSFVLFNEEAKRHIQGFGYTQKETLAALNNCFDRAKTPTAGRNIAEFKPSAIALKTVWWLIKKDGITPLPIWDGIPSSGNTSPSSNSFTVNTWTDCVGVDPSNSQLKPPNLICNQTKLTDFRIVPLSQFYWVKILDEEQRKTVANATEAVPDGANAAIGDYVVLVGMHVTTKEIPNWVWASFWWDDRSKGEFAQDRPNEVQGVWRNFLMTTAYSMTHPDNTPLSAFNPWLETRFPDGVHSNCMNCHRKAALVEPGGNHKGIDFAVERGEIPAGDDRFKNAVQLDFIWSINIESQELPIDGGLSALQTCLPQPQNKLD
jgi:hypothetical protein